MARQPRIDIPGQPQHIWVRGNNRGALFTSDLERYYYLRAMQQALARRHCELHAYVLMTNHVHLLVTARQAGGISLMVQDIGRIFVRFINNQRHRTGTLFEGRYRASPVDTDRYFLTVMRYIELNPVRAGMVSHPSEHPWSSFAANRSGAPLPPLTPHPTYLGLGREADSRGERYLRLFDRPISDAELTAIRESLRECRVLGTPEFEKALSERLGRAAGPAGHGGKRPGQGRKRIKGSVPELTP